MVRAVASVAALLGAVAVGLLGAAAPAVGPFAAPALGAASRDGWGLAVADDDADYVRALGVPFGRLEPRAFRFMLPWDVAERPAELERVRAVIARVRSMGVRQVVATFRTNPDLPADEVRPPPATYGAHVRRPVRELADGVDVWGPANEPNAGTRWLVGPDGPALAAGYYRALNRVLEEHDPTARLLSPAFHDRPELGSIRPYIRRYERAGGGFGDHAAWHPYWGVHRMTVRSTDDLASALPPGHPIWVTEAGAFGRNAGRGIHRSEEAQADRVAWMADVLARHPRVERVHYYHLRAADDPGFPWDTALTRPDGTARPAWHAWCAAAHGDEPFHGSCRLPGERSDANGDGRSDLVALTATGGAYVHRGMVGGGLEARSRSLPAHMGAPPPGGEGHELVDLADVTGDRMADLVTVTGAGLARVAPGTGSGGFARAVASPVGPMRDALLHPGGREPIAAADVTGEGNADLVTVPEGLGPVHVHPGEGDGTFEPAGVASLAGAVTSPPSTEPGRRHRDVADVTGDGRADLVELVPGGSVRVHPGRPDGAFAGGVTSLGSVTPAADGTAGHEPVGTGDVNGDGRADLVTLLEGTALTHLGEAAGTFLSPPVASFAGTMDSSLPDGEGHEPIGLLDVDGDGHADLVTAHTDGNLYAYGGLTTGAFDASPSASPAGALRDRVSNRGLAVGR